MNGGILNSTVESLKFKFLKDEPASKEQEGFFNFYHEHFSPALKEIVENDSCVHTIGLFGRWGTGKSTIIDLLQKELKLKLFLFDAWKYQDDSLRRIFLIKLVEFLKKNDVAIENNILDPLYKSSEIASTETISNAPDGLRQKLWALLKAYWLFLLVIVFGIAWLGLSYFAGRVGFLAETKSIFKYLFSFTAVISIATPILQRVLDESMNRIFQSVLPWSEVRAKVEKEDRLNSPEQFEDLFNKVVGSIGKDEKIVIVFDNVDRVQGDTAIKVLSTIKTFLDPLNKTNVVFIVPCDADAIIQQIRSFYGKDIPEGETFDPSEYLRKLFNVVIYTPEFIDTDLEAYTKHLLKQTGDIKELLVDEDVILVINRAFPNNPREIKQFINNLISMVLVASKTEVNDLIVQKGKIAYLAKVLVLKQKFPKAYARLKEKWYEPDNILRDDDEPELANFLNATSPITTDDAEPYIYFKKPAVARDITDPQPLRQYLLNGDEKQFTAAFTAETNKDAVVDYVLLLLNRYQNQHDPLLNIFKTQLAVFAAGALTTTKRSYFDESLKILDNQLWQDYLSLPANTIFSFLLSSSLASKALKARILERYLLALGADQLKQQGGEHQKLRQEVFKNLIAHQQLLSADQKTKLSEVIEQGYASRATVLGLFTDKADQEKYISEKAIEQFIASINLKTIDSKSTTLLAYKDYILKHKLVITVLKKMQEVIGIETGEAPDYRAQKDALATTMNKLFAAFHKNISDLPAPEKQQFGQVFLQAFNSIGNWDNRGVYVNILRWIYPQLDPPQTAEYKSVINQFFQNSATSKIKAVIEYWGKDFIPTYIGEHIAVLMPRMVNDDALRDLIYGLANKEDQVKILTYLINNRPDQALPFLESLGDSIPERPELVRTLLSKTGSMPYHQCEAAYKYINEKLSKNDDNAIKDLAVEQIQKLLKSEDSASQKVGFDFLSGAEFLSIERKREIGKEVLEYLRQPGKNLHEIHRFGLKAVASLYESLQDTLKHDLVYLLFDSIRQEKSKSAIEVFFEVLKELSPKFSDFEKDYQDLLERLKNWPEGETRSLVLETLVEFKSKSPTKIEKEYWSEIESLSTKTST